MSRWIFACEHDMQLDSWKACDLCFSQKNLRDLRSISWTNRYIPVDKHRTKIVCPMEEGEKRIIQRHVQTIHCCKLLALAVVAPCCLFTACWALWWLFLAQPALLPERKKTVGQSLYMLIPCLWELSKTLTKIHLNLSSLPPQILEIRQSLDSPLSRSPYDLWSPWSWHKPHEPRWGRSGIALGGSAQVSRTKNGSWSKWK